MENYYYTLSIPTAVYRKLNKKQSINKYFKTEYVGNCMELITDFYKTTSDYTHNAWEDYYKEIVGFTQLELVYEKEPLALELILPILLITGVPKPWPPSLT